MGHRLVGRERYRHGTRDLLRPGVPRLPPGAFIRPQQTSACRGDTIPLRGHPTAGQDARPLPATGGRQAAVLGTGIRLSGRQDVVFFVYSVQSHAGHRARVGREEVDTRGTRTAGGRHHALAEPKLHLPGREVGNHDDEPPHE